MHLLILDFPRTQITNLTPTERSQPNFGIFSRARWAGADVRWPVRIITKLVEPGYWAVLKIKPLS